MRKFGVDLTESFIKVANQLNTKVIALTYGSSNPDLLNHYGADIIINVTNVNFENASNVTIAKTSVNVIKQYDIDTIIISNTN